MPQAVAAYGFIPAETFTIKSTSGAIFKGVGRRRAGAPQVIVVLPDTTDAVDTDYTLHAIVVGAPKDGMPGQETASTIDGDTYLGVISHGSVLYAVFKE